MCRDMLQKEGRANAYEIASSAVSTEEIWGGVGNPVYPPVASLLRGKGIDCTGKRARLLTAKDGEYYELFVCMDDSNVRGAVRILGERHAGKCVKLLSFLDSDEDVSDPWYTRDFQTCYEDICRGLQAMLRKIR